MTLLRISASNYPAEKRRRAREAAQAQEYVNAIAPSPHHRCPASFTPVLYDSARVNRGQQLRHAILATLGVTLPGLETAGGQNVAACLSNRMSVTRR